MMSSLLINKLYVSSDLRYHREGAKVSYQYIHVHTYSTQYICTYNTYTVVSVLLDSTYIHTYDMEKQ